MIGPNRGEPMHKKTQLKGRPGILENSPVNRTPRSVPESRWPSFCSSTCRQPSCCRTTCCWTTCWRPSCVGNCCQSSCCGQIKTVCSFSQPRCQLACCETACYKTSCCQLCCLPRGCINILLPACCQSTCYETPCCKTTCFKPAYVTSGCSESCCQLLCAQLRPALLPLTNSPRDRYLHDLCKITS